jgi:hypothetical protein
MPAAAPVAPVPTGSNAAFQLGQSDLQRIERALLDAILDVRRDDANAIDDLLNDPNFAGDRTEVERFLAAAVMDTRSDRSRALDQMLCDGALVAPIAAHA